MTIVMDACIQLVLSLVAIFAVTTVLLGLDPWSAFIIDFTISCVLFNLIGLMYWWSIDFNAVSVVNLVMVRLLVVFYRFKLQKIFENLKFSSVLFTDGGNIGGILCAHCSIIFAKRSSRSLDARPAFSFKHGIIGLLLCLNFQLILKIFV